MGSKILSGKGAIVAWGGWVRDALPFEGHLLHSAGVDPENDLVTLTAVGVDKTTTKGPFQWGFSG
jgi:hypothetical protein